MICGITLQRSFYKGKPQLRDLPLSHPFKNTLQKSPSEMLSTGLMITLNFLKA